MSRSKRHNQARYDRTQEAIRLSRERKRLLQAADEKAAHVCEAIARIVRRRSRRTGMPVCVEFAYTPGTPFKRGTHRGSMAKAARLVWQLANELGIPIRIEAEHIPLDRPQSPLPEFEGPRRHRDYALPPPKVSFDWDPLYDRIRHESNPLEDEARARIRAAREWWRQNGRQVGIRGLGTVFDDASAPSSVQQRNAHHPQCASRHPIPGVVRRSAAGKLVNPLGECDCGLLVLLRFGTLTISIERHGRVKLVQAPTLTRDRVRFVDPERGDQPGDEAGFAGELSTDSCGLALIPWNKPFTEYGDGTISFADAGIPRKRTPEAAS